MVSKRCTRASAQFSKERPELAHYKSTKKTAIVMKVVRHTGECLPATSEQKKCYDFGTIPEETVKEDKKKNEEKSEDDNRVAGRGGTDIAKTERARAAKRQIKN